MGRYFFSVGPFFSGRVIYGPFFCLRGPFFFLPDAVARSGMLFFVGLLVPFYYISRFFGGFWGFGARSCRFRYFGLSSVCSLSSIKVFFFGACLSGEFHD